MEKEFVPFELAVKLKELGFDEPCFAAYHTEYKISSTCSDGIKNSDLHLSLPSAPLWQQAFDWFREKHKIISFVSFHIKGSFRIETLPDSEIILTSYKQRYFDNNGKLWDSYKETEKAALEKLIEIVSRC